MPIPQIARTLSDLADEIGFAPAVLLSGAWGGSKIYIPQEIPRAHPIARLFDAGGCGFGAAASLASLYGGRMFDVPSLKAYEVLRAGTIAQPLLQGGAEIADVARLLGVSESTIRRRVAEVEMLGLAPKVRHDDLRQRRFIAAQARHKDAEQPPPPHKPKRKGHSK